MKKIRILSFAIFFSWLIAANCTFFCSAFALDIATKSQHSCCPTSHKTAPIEHSCCSPSIAAQSFEKAFVNEFSFVKSPLNFFAITSQDFFRTFDNGFSSEKVRLVHERYGPQQGFNSLLSSLKISPNAPPILDVIFS